MNVDEFSLGSAHLSTKRAFFYKIKGPFPR